MGKIDHHDQKQLQKTRDRVDAVLHLLKKQAPLSLKQERYCSRSSVERFVKAKGENVKKAAKNLRACLSWRESIGIENLIADEFSTEIADGVAYVSGYDDDSRPVLIFRIKQDYHKFHSQKMLTRLVVFTLEVAIQSMAKNVDQFVILFDASFFRSGPAFMNMLLTTLKIIADYYPCRLYKAFVIDPPSIFSYLWKGVKAFVGLSPYIAMVSSLDFQDSSEFNDLTVPYSRASSSVRFDSSSVQSTARIGSCASTRFSFTVAHHFDSVKPWYLSLGDTSASKVGPTLAGPALLSSANARSFSFASPAARTSRGNINPVARKSFFPSTPLPQRTQTFDHTNIKQPRTPNPSFLQSPAMSFFTSKKECHVSKATKCRESFSMFLKFYRRPYDEMTYRSKMRPPLGGLISIVAPQLRRRHMSVSQRF
ncbi:Random slug protein 5 [Heracleum sosnowskyi]|uniref:Random slug protein 5 n=1 Tax=Heracleum sosnowskyi TaxID=360622 RepID=A0AAD8N589_9APIA|nr:Random slug protein 5 [Heracleum sosnowskyi]